MRSFSRASASAAAAATDDDRMKFQKRSEMI